MINEPNYEEVDFCRLTNVGENLLHDFGVETAQLNPEHYFIPWITFNNVRFSKVFFFLPKMYDFSLQVWNKTEFEAALADLESFLCNEKLSHVEECK